jgi:cytochrome P450
MREKGAVKFEGGNYPLLGTGFFFKLAIYVSDPEVVRDLMTTKNKLIDKDIFQYLLFYDTFGDSFLAQKTNASWHEKRKACSHAFYKERMQVMMHTL